MGLFQQVKSREYLPVPARNTLQHFLGDGFLPLNLFGISFAIGHRPSGTYVRLLFAAVHHLVDIRGHCARWCAQNSGGAPALAVRRAASFPNRLEGCRSFGPRSAPTSSAGLSRDAHRRSSNHWRVVTPKPYPLGLAERGALISDHTSEDFGSGSVPPRVSGDFPALPTRAALASESWRPVSLQVQERVIIGSILRGGRLSLRHPCAQLAAIACTG